MSSEITINSNIASLQTQRRLGQNSSALRQVFERLSSGQRINRASDDAAGLAISDSLSADRRVLTQGVRNLNDGVSLLNIGEGALSELTNIVTRVKELAEQAANGTLGYWQRQSLDKEAQQLSKEYTRIAQTAEFNGIKIFDGSVSVLTLQGGYGSSGAVVASIGGAIGTGSFAAPSSFTTETSNSQAVTLGDLNGDGILDLVTTGSVGYATVRLGTGSGSFAVDVSYATESAGSNSVYLGDLNGDGILDLVTAGTSGGGRATVRLGTGSGSFGAATSYTAEGVISAAVTLGDLNCDGILDLVTSGASGGIGYATVRLGTGSGTFGAATSFSTDGYNSLAITLGDLNGDGILDLVAAGAAAGNGYATVRLGTGSGSFGAATSFTTEITGSNGVTLGDLNGDGILDLVTAGYGGGTGGANVRLGTGSGSFGAAISYTAETNSSREVTLGDLNGDGILDLVTAGLGGGGRANVRLGTGSGSFGAATSFATEANGSYGVALGDLNGDGVLDLVTAGLVGASGRANVGLGNTQAGVGSLLKFSLKTKGDALQSMPDLDRALKRISAHRGHIGAFQSRIGSAINNVQITIENYMAAESQIRDTDVAQEAANLAKGRILQQAAASVLAQANLEPQIALKLLQGQ